MKSLDDMTEEELGETMNLIRGGRAMKGTIRCWAKPWNPQCSKPGEKLRPGAVLVGIGETPEQACEALEQMAQVPPGVLDPATCQQITILLGWQGATTPRLVLKARHPFFARADNGGC